ncbi:MAG: hypothetical protein ACJ74O_08190 [Frankiaceae bacterium]
MAGDIAIRVVEADVRSYATDVLVLKHAQALYGVDAAVVEAAGLDHADLPMPGQHRLIRSPRGIASRNVLFVGMPGLFDVQYQELRELGRRALSASATEVPDARQVTMTLHGPGFGLDEQEALHSLLAGIIDAVRAGSYPPALTWVTFAEISPRRAERMRSAIDDVLPEGVVEPGSPAEPVHVVSRLAARLESVGRASMSKQHAFMAMPFDGTFDDHYDYAIVPALNGLGLLCERVDQMSFTGDVMQLVVQRIRTASYVIAEVSQPNPNVYLEIGLAWGHGVPTVLLRGANAPPTPFDVRGQRLIEYNRIKDLETRLRSELAALSLVDGDR